MSSPSTSDALTPFGAPMLKHFLFDKNVKNLNHGSWGTYPRQIQTTLRKYQAEAESHPDKFIRYTYPKLLDESRKAAAKLLSVPVEECVFVGNATTGINTVLRNLVFQPGDTIIYFATIYGAIEKTIVSLQETTPLLQARKVEYEFPISHGELVERFLRTVHEARGEGLNVRIAVFDTIVSNPGVRFPFERLIEVCRDEGVLSLIDGAHGIGHIPLDLGRLGPDFLTTNCHKWLYTPRGSAILYVPKRNQHLIRTTFPTSWGFIPSSSPSSPETAFPQEKPKSRFELLFQLVATADNIPYLCVPEAIKFRNEVCGGDERIYGYLESLANEAADVVASALGTEVMQEEDLRQGGEVSQLRRCGMNNVRLPFVIVDESENGDNEDNSTYPYPPLKKEHVGPLSRWIGETLVEKYDTFVPVFLHGGALWTRLSAQVYLEKRDFEWLGGVLKELCDLVVKGEVDLDAM